MGRGAGQLTASATSRSISDGRHAELWRATEKLADNLEREIGSLDQICAPAATILAALLREQGIDAKVECGVYLDIDPDEPALAPVEESHAYVRVACEDAVGDELILDPTRGQFDDGAIICEASDPQYRRTNEDWGTGLAPPSEPTIADACKFIESWWASGSDSELKREALLNLLEASSNET